MLAKFVLKQLRSIATDPRRPATWLVETIVKRKKVKRPVPQGLLARLPSDCWEALIKRLTLWNCLIHTTKLLAGQLYKVISMRMLSSERQCRAFL